MSSLRARRFCWTWNNPHQRTSVPCAALPLVTTSLRLWEEAARDIKAALTALPHFRFLVFQLEIGAGGTPHVQGYTEFTQTTRGAVLLRVLEGAHLEQARGDADSNIAYCSKAVDDETGLPARFWPDAEPTREGEPSLGQGNRSDIHDAIACIEDGGNMRQLAREHPAAFLRYYRGFSALIQYRSPPVRTVVPEVYLIHGKTGLGKTRAVWDLMKGKEEKMYEFTPGAGAWFDFYDGEPVLLMDEYVGCLPLCLLLRVLDRYKVKVPVKGSFVDLSAVRYIFITSNLHPSAWYDWKGREEQYHALRRRIDGVYCQVDGMCDPLILVESDPYWGRTVARDGFDYFGCVEKKPAKPLTYFFKVTKEVVCDNEGERQRVRWTSAKIDV